MNDSRPSNLKAHLISQTEHIIDGLRKRRAEIEPELQHIDRELNEAREMLQLLKTGAVQQPKSKRKKTDEALALEALDAMDSEFTTHDYAEALEITRNTSATWLKKFMDKGLLTRKLFGRGNQPSIWVKQDD